MQVIEVKKLPEKFIVRESGMMLLKFVRTGWSREKDSLTLSFTVFPAQCESITMKKYRSGFYA
jgi:hypothetical protein